MGSLKIDFLRIHSTFWPDFYYFHADFWHSKNVDVYSFRGGGRVSQKVYGLYLMKMVAFMNGT